MGWALNDDGPPARLRIIGTHPLAGGGHLRRTLVATRPNAVRPDVAERFPDVPDAELGGFSIACSLLGLPREFGLRVEAGFGGSHDITIARIEGTRPALDTGFRPRFQPILVHTLGRAGSTWLTQLVGEHPQALAYRPFDYEPRMLDYWMEVARTLSHPRSYAQTVDPDVRSAEGWWTGSAREKGPLLLHRDPPVERWVETESVEELAAFAQRRIDSFYGRVAEAQGKPDALRFVERAHEWEETTLARELFDRARVVFLVRDLRDLLASRLAFNRKTGLAQFGYDDATGDDATGDEAYVHGTMRRQVAGVLESWRAQRDDALLLRYEDLMRHPRETLRTLLDHVGLESGDDEVAGVLERARARAPDRQARHRTTPDEAASIGRWRRDLPPALQEACAEAFGPALEAFGYEPAEAP